MSATLTTRVRRLLDTAGKLYAGTPQQPIIADLTRRLDEPLRLAIAGKVKAGKSTLLNALVGQELAATDAGECTRVVTWYQDSHTYRVTAYPVNDSPQQLPFSHDGDGAAVQLNGWQPTDLRQIVVEWPSAALRTVTLIDTPGIASLSTDLSARAHHFLTADDDQPGVADAVLYLMRHLHRSDVDFLESFHDDAAAARATPINAVGVLSRADEIGVGRLDAMSTARRIASRYRTDPQVARLCQTVVPVAGLLAEGGATLREDEYRAFRALADAGRLVTDDLLRSADRFVRADADTDLAVEVRRDLIARFGLYGVRLGVALVRRGTDSAAALAQRFVDYSGLEELREAMTTQLVQRRDVLKCRSVLAALHELVRTDGRAEALALARELEQVQASAHEFAEVRVLNALRGGVEGLRPEHADQAHRLLGGAGLTPAERLGLAGSTDAAELRHAGEAAVTQWRRRAENPLASVEAAHVAEVVIRSAEGILADLAPR